MKNGDVKAHIISGVLGALTSYLVVVCLVTFLFAAALIPVDATTFVFCLLLLIVPVIFGVFSGILAYKIAGSRKRDTTFWITFPGLLLGIIIVVVLELNIREIQVNAISLNLLRILDLGLWIIGGIIVEVVITGSMRLYKMMHYSEK